MSEWHCECRRFYRYVNTIETDGRGVCVEDCGNAECYRRGPIVEPWRVPPRDSCQGHGTDAKRREATDVTDDELSAAIAVEVMGWRPWPSEFDVHGWVLPGETIVGPSLNHWQPTTDIADAFEVVERMTKQGWEFSVCTVNPQVAPCLMEIEFWHPGKPGHASRNHLPRAICEAALETVRSDGGKHENQIQHRGP